MSGGQRKKVSKALVEEVGRYTRDSVMPYLAAQFQSYGCASECQVSVSDDGESVHIYPAVAADAKGYLRDHVLVEFGGRNIIDPNAVHTIQPDIAGMFETISFPKAEGVVCLLYTSPSPRD